MYLFPGLAGYGTRMHGPVEWLREAAVNRRDSNHLNIGRGRTIGGWGFVIE
jgi:hypothetical protein